MSAPQRFLCTLSQAYPLSSSLSTFKSRTFLFLPFVRSYLTLTPSLSPMPRNQVLFLFSFPNSSLPFDSLCFHSRIPTSKLKFDDHMLSRSNLSFRAFVFCSKVARTRSGDGKRKRKPRRSCRLRETRLL